PAQARPAAVRVPASDVDRPRGRAGFPARPPGHHVVPGVRPGAAVRSGAGVGRAGQLRPAARRRLPVDGVAALGAVLPGRVGGVHGHRHRAGHVDDPHRTHTAAGPAGGVAAGVGDAAPGVTDGVAVVVRLAVRHRQLATGQSRVRRLRRPLVAAEPDVVLRGRGDRGRLDERAVRGVHRLRGADPGARRRAGSRRAGRRERVAAVPHGDRADDPAGAAHRRSVADHLEPQGVHADLRAAGRRRHHARDQPDRHLHLPARHRGGAVRAGRRGLVVHLAGHRGAEPVLRADSAEGRGRVMIRARRRWLLSTVAVLLAVVWAFPVYWMINSSFLPINRIQSETPTFVPIDGTVDAYDRAFSGGFFSALKMSMVVTLITIGVALVLAFLAALALSRFRFRGRRSFLIAVLVIQMIPAEGLFISQFKQLDAWDMLNTVGGLSLLYIATLLPFTIWLLRGFVNGVPVELEEAAMVDGCSRTQAFVRVTL